MLVCAVAGSVSYACASGGGAASEDDGGTGSSDASMTDGSFGDAADGSNPRHDSGPSGPNVGSPCPDGKCATGTCTPLGGTSYCTTPCPPACPNGTYCSIIGGTSICVPDLGQECQKCTASTDCKLPSDNCLTAPLGDSFCARDCTADGMCPTGFACVAAQGYGPAPEGGADGGTGEDGGSGDDGGTSEGGAGTDGAVPSMPDMWCVPANGASCACGPARDGVTNSCSISNDAGTCQGTETCAGDAGTFVGCSAMTPMPEICNGKDDNCNGMVDEGDPNMLCAFMGPTPPNANWACVNGACQLGTCDPGWTAFPSGNTTTGCACMVDSNQPNGTCATATNMGSIKDTATAPLVLAGTLSSASMVEVFSFDTVDDLAAANAAGANVYHVSLAFTAPASNTEFVMDVIRGNTCTDAPTGPSTNITAYDWCVDGTGTQGGMPVGENPCGAAPAPGRCTDHSSQYYVRVYRASGATATCTPFQITVTAGGGTCDFAQTCP
jgi:hypothetical protein